MEISIAFSLAMVSSVQYAKLPRVGFRSVKGVLGLLVNVSILAFGIWSRDIFFFPLGIAYLSYGMVRAAALGFLERGDEVEEGAPRAIRLPFVIRAREHRRRKRDADRETREK